MLKGFKYKLDLNNQQKDYLNKTFGCCRFVYNLALETKIHAYQSNRFNLSEYDLKNQLPDLKKDNIWLKDVSSAALCKSISQLNDAFKRFYKGSGFPKFKKKSSKQSCKFDQTIDVDFTNHKIKIPKIGWINFYRDRNFKGKIKSITVSKNSCGFYFASVLVDTNIKQLEKNDKIIGIDLGLKHFLTDSEGNKFDNPKFLQTGEKIIKKHQRRLARKIKGSGRYKKQKEKLARVHYKIANQRKNFLHKLSRKIVNDNQIICLEDLAVQEMMKKENGFGRPIGEVGWNEFVRQLKYKSEWYGRNFVQINRYFPSSKLCNNCKWKYDDLVLEVREWECLNCGEVHDRDLNAAKNISEEGIRIISENKKIKKTGSDGTSEDVELSELSGTKKRQVTS